VSTQLAAAKQAKAMENLQLQNAHGLDLQLPLTYDEDDPVVSFCLDSTEEGVLYAATSSGMVHCFGKKVRGKTF
jgi:hypothetical protein